jgi:hypothetical protein
MPYNNEMTDAEFEMRKDEITTFIKDYNSKYHNNTDSIMKIRLLDRDDLFDEYKACRDWVLQEEDLFEIEEDDYAYKYANTEDYDDEEELFNDDDNITPYEIMLMFKCGDQLYTLGEVGERDKHGNSRLEGWLCEEHFKTDRLIPKYKQISMLKKLHVDSGWNNLFPVFVIYGEPKGQEEKPITEATRIILEETKNRIQKPVINYTYEYLNIKWTEYIKENTELYDEKFFALITTKAIKETINWKWICEELNKEE